MLSLPFDGLARFFIFFFFSSNWEAAGRRDDPCIPACAYTSSSDCYCFASDPSSLKTVVLWPFFFSLFFFCFYFLYSIFSSSSYCYCILSISFSKVPGTHLTDHAVSTGLPERCFTSPSAAVASTNGVAIIDKAPAPFANNSTDIRIQFPFDNTPRTFPTTVFSIEQDPGNGCCRAAVRLRPGPIRHVQGPPILQGTTIPKYARF